MTIPVPTSVALEATLCEEESLANSVLEEIRVQVGRRVSGHWTKVRGRQAGQRIVAEARELGVGTVVMPTAAGDRSDWAHAVETVMRERPCPVVLESVPATQRSRVQAYRMAPQPVADPHPAPAEPRRPPAAVAGPALPGAAPRPWENVPEATGEVQPDASGDDGADVVLHASKAVLALGALGVVYGDLGTSPLYTEQTIYTLHAAHQINPLNVFGITSLIFWSLTLIVSFKYATLIMRAHNHGDGGGMALAMLIRRNKVPHTVALVTLGLIGASLFLGDGVITPAISVLSAVSGLSIVSSSFNQLVVPISLVILLVLFVIQRRGSATVGQLFGPVMLLWFAVLAVMGIFGLASDPAVLKALSPSYGIQFCAAHGIDSFLTFGGVVLCVTGAEALYADRGHFGPGAIRISWFAIVMPSVVLNYLGQSAVVLQHPRDASNPFFLMVPSWAEVPLVILSTLATIIASQAVISGSYSVARQAMRMGYLPRLKIVHTSDLEGQIYIPVINWMLAAGVVVLVIIFQSSSSLANAYGVAVTGTFLLNTSLFLAVAHYIWRRPMWRLILLGTLLGTVETTFLLANLAKILHGAWVPLLIGFTLTSVMLIWNRGRAIVTANRIEREGPMREFIQELEANDPPVTRVPGVGIFMSPGRDTTPLAMRAALEYTHSLHAKV
ncbi:MAG TPA: KUP/HAK/KT family potassium transporter, partial [Solirubrobacteraceae bacterium]|nr:KUP/HAK/KT family potassium transporter [Solirubrobacteraceae bacterium]